MPPAVKSEPVYVMPAVAPGDVVLWHEGGRRGANAFPALVTRVNGGYYRDEFKATSISLAIFSPENQNLMIRDGVRHIDDPKSSGEEGIENGSWEATAISKRLADLEATVRKIQYGDKGK